MKSHAECVQQAEPVTLVAWRNIEPKVRAYLRRAIRDRTSEKALLAEVLAECLLELALEPRGELAWPQLLAIVRRCARDYKRQARRDARTVYDVDRLEADNDSSAHRAYRLAVWEWAECALSHLGGMQRAALELYEMDNRSDADIACELGCAPASVRVLRHHAKRRVRELVIRGIVPAPPAEAP